MTSTKSTEVPDPRPVLDDEIPLGAELGARIKRARTERGLSQEELGLAIGYKGSMVSAFENGTRRLKLEDLARVCVALAKEPGYFLRIREIGATATHRVGVTLRAELAGLHHPELSSSITSFLDAVERRPLPESSVPDLHDLRPAGAARALLDRCGLTDPPVQVDEIAERLGVPIIGWNFPDSLSALIVEVNDDGNYVIGRNKAHGRSRRRFSVAHELGHAVLRHGAAYHLEFFSADDGDPPNFNYQDEREANTFAAALLMDERWLREDWCLRSHDVPALADRYQVSREAMSFRLMNLALT
jgi:transcriptional regulator with XRE-family HTH domain